MFVAIEFYINIILCFDTRRRHRVTFYSRPGDFQRSRKLSVCQVAAISGPRAVNPQTDMNDWKSLRPHPRVGLNVRIGGRRIIIAAPTQRTDLKFPVVSPPRPRDVRDLYENVTVSLPPVVVGFPLRPTFPCLSIESTTEEIVRQRKTINSQEVFHDYCARILRLRRDVGCVGSKIIPPEKNLTCK